MKKTSDNVPAGEGIYLGTDPEDRDLHFFMPESWRVTGTFVCGSSGSGKTTAMSDWITQDIMAGRGAGVIDPKGDLIDALLAHLAMLDESYWPSLAERIVLIDPSDSALTPGINPLEIRQDAAPGRQRQEVHSVLAAHWGLESSTAPRLDLVLRRTIHLLMEAHATLADMPRLLSDDDYRSGLLHNVHDRDLHDFWTRVYPQGDAGHQWSLSLLTRIGSLLDDPGLRRMFSSPHTDVDFADLMNRGQTLLVSLCRGRLGDSSAATLGRLLTVQLLMAAESRQQIWPPERRRRWRLYADEFSGFLAGSALSELFAQGRGYGVTLCVANQALAQIDDELRASIFANCRTLIAFRLSAGDSRAMAAEQFVYEGNREKTRSLQFIRINRVPVPIGFYKTYKSAAEEARENREALHTLRDREFFVRFAERNLSGKLRSFDVPPVDRAVIGDRVERLRALLARARPLPHAREMPRLLRQPATDRHDWRPPPPRS